MRCSTNICQSAQFRKDFSRGISITAQKAATLLHQTAETAFKDQKCHFIMTAFIYLSFKIFLKNLPLPILKPKVTFLFGAQFLF